MDRKTLKLLICFATLANCEVRKPYCPRSCICDTFEGLNRADCSQQRLINAHTDVPDMVEILDLSRNDISELDEKSFKNFSRVVDLSLTQNRISDISLNTFTMMSRLRQLDLSYNSLEEFDYRIVEHNKDLTALDLSGNKFMSLKNRPIIISASLQVLILRDTKLSHVHQLFFTEVPKLRQLDLSQNLLVTIYHSAFGKLKHLEEINVEDNQWNCDENWKSVAKWFKKREIKVKKNQCFKKKQVFEKMETNITEPPREDVEINLVWNLTETSESSIETSTKPPTPYDELFSVACESVEFFDSCPYFNACKSNLTDLYQNYTEALRHIEIYKANHLAAVITMCYVGIFFGALAGASLMFLICCLKDRKVSHLIAKTNEKQKLRKAIKERTQFAHEAATPAAAPSTSVPRVVSLPPALPITPERVPSFRNSVDRRVQPRSLAGLRHARYFKRREDEMPPVLRYFRRTPRFSMEERQEGEYFLANQVADRPSEGLEPEVRRPISNAVSNSSVVYSEVNESSAIPAAFCCAEHSAITRQVSLTPPPSYIDCMIKTSDTTQAPLRRHLSLS